MKKLEEGSIISDNEYMQWSLIITEVMILRTKLNEIIDWINEQQKDKENSNE